jgi:hypothetical protein
MKGAASASWRPWYATRVGLAAFLPNAAYHANSAPTQPVPLPESVAATFMD